MVYERCPWQFYRTFVLRESPPISAAMRAGSRLHKTIADHYRQPGLFVPDVDPRHRTLFDFFLASRFNRQPVLSESSFVLPFSHATVRGRIDVVLPFQDGYEIVDFKSGAGEGRADMVGTLQLPIYAMAVIRRLQVPAVKVDYTYFFLRDGAEMSTHGTDAELANVAVRVQALLDRIRARDFSPPDGCSCFACRRVPVTLPL